MKRKDPHAHSTKITPPRIKRPSTSLPPLHGKQPHKPQKAKPEKPVKPSRRKTYATFVLITLSLLTTLTGVLVGTGVGLFNQYLDDMPKIDYLEDYQPSMASRMFSGDESRQLVADFFKDKQNREKVPLYDIPDHLINALISIEDHMFYDHPGISMIGFIRAAYYDIKNRNLRNGGSTITMQLAEDLIKNEHLPYKLPDMGLKSFQQKIYEIFIALHIEKRFTKDEILEFYLNQVFMGGKLYGVAVAAESYLNKDISELTLKECALFAGMQQLPNRYSPKHNLEAAYKRTNVVLSIMLKRGFITQEEYEQAKEEKFQLSTKGKRRTQVALYPYYSNAVLRQFTGHKIKTTEGLPIDIYGHGIDIESTMNVAMQQAAEDALKTGIVQHEHRRHTSGGRHWGEPGYRMANTPGPGTLKAGEEYDAKLLSDYDPQAGTVQITIPNIKGGQGPFTVEIVPNETWLDEFDLLHKNYFITVASYQHSNEIRFKLAKDEYAQGALVAVRPSTGEVLAQVGGYDFYDRQNAGQFIRSIQATSLQPGSAFKPLLFTAALADPEKKWNISSILVDEKKEYWTGWTPRNFYDEYYGNVTMLYSLTHSLNAASVWLLDNYQSTRAKSIENLRTFCRFAFELPVEEQNLSIALGTTGTTPMELAQAYSVLANEGIYRGLHMVNKVYQRTDSRNASNLLYEFKHSHAPEGRMTPQYNYSPQQRISPQVAYLATYMLRNVVEDGTGKPALELPFYSVGKTGTTDDCTYGWYAGYSKDILCIVYLGYDDYRRSLGRKMTGSQVALPVWMEFMQRAYEIQPELFGTIDPPPGIVFHNVCTESGELASSECPLTRSLPYEKGAEPLDECRIHGHDSLSPYRNASNQLILSDQRFFDYDTNILSVD